MASRLAEQTPSSPSRRVTRSSSNQASPRTSTAVAAVGPSTVSAEKTQSVEGLLASLPGRGPQLRFLLQLLYPGPSLPILLHGATATGKTTTLLAALRHLRLGFIYFSSRSLLLRPRFSPTDFISALKASILSRKSGPDPAAYVVFDNLELLNTTILPILLRLPDLLNLQNVGFIYVSRSSPNAYFSFFGSVEPIFVHFTDYTSEELHDVLVSNQSNPILYSSFLSVVLKPFCRVTRRLDELATALDPLYEKYCEPLSSQNVVPEEKMKRRLFEYVQPHLSAALNETFFCKEYSIGGGEKESAAKKLGRKDVFSGLGFHMSSSAKYLLLSAFLASRNPATLDAAFFDSTGHADNRKRRRRNSQTAESKKENAEEEMRMRGPGTFPLERLLAIFQCIASVSDDALEEEGTRDCSTTEVGKINLMCDVLLQLSTLCNSNLLYKTVSCPLEGSARYRCNIDEDMALKVARSINFPLSKYLYRR